MQRFDYKFKAMGSPCTLHFYAKTERQGDNVYNACLQEAKRLEHKYSRYRQDSLLSAINRQAGKSLAIDNETFALLNYAGAAYKMSEGLFDITTGALSKIWDFSQAIVPSIEQISEQKSKIGWPNITWDNQSITLPNNGMQIDFGGIVKEYAADALATILKQHSVDNGLVDMGGDIHVLGTLIDGSPWEVGISDPAHPEQAIAKIPMVSGGLASSGDYQRYFMHKGKRYSHILNPKTGWPVTGLASVSVWHEQCVIAGTVATIAMLKGEEGISWLQALDIPFLAITSENKEIVTNQVTRN